MPSLFGDVLDAERPHCPQTLAFGTRILFVVEAPDHQVLFRKANAQLLKGDGRLRRRNGKTRHCKRRHYKWMPGGQVRKGANAEHSTEVATTV